MKFLENMALYYDMVRYDMIFFLFTENGFLPGGSGR